MNTPARGRCLDLGSAQRESCPGRLYPHKSRLIKLLNRHRACNDTYSVSRELLPRTPRRQWDRQCHMKPCQAQASPGWAYYRALLRGQRQAPRIVATKRRPDQNACRDGTFLYFNVIVMVDEEYCSIATPAVDCLSLCNWEQGAPEAVGPRRGSGSRSGHAVSWPPVVTLIRRVHCLTGGMM